MTVNTRPPQNALAARTDAPSTNGADGATPAEGKTRRKRGTPEKHWVSINVTKEQSEGLREMARAAGGKTSDFYSSLLSPIIDKALADFDENRDLVAARAKATAAATAAQRAQELADKAKAELAEVEASKK